MYKEERRRLIMEHIEQEGSLTVTEMAAKLGVSEVTIRKDIRHLAAMDLVERTHGGALRKSLAPHVFSFRGRQQRNIKEKTQIGRFCASLVTDGQLIILDSGTTTFKIAENISSKRLRVMTNNILIATELLKWNTVSVTLVGGAYREVSIPLTGETAERLLRTTKDVDLAFISCSGIGIDGVVYNDYAPEVGTKRAMISAARQAVLVADSSKVGLTGAVPFASLHDFDHLVTNRAPAIEPILNSLLETTNIIISQA